MIVYAGRKRRVPSKIVAGNWRDTLIRFGEVEAAVADMLLPEIDQPLPVLQELRAIGIRLAAGDASALDRLPPLPKELCISVPEGYAYYALYPEDYAAAAQRFLRETRPRQAVVVGIRSIGTSLSSVVAATLEQAGCNVSSFTVRPHGHPFDRTVHWQGVDIEPNAWFLIVDEGPGLSGSSFAAVARRLSELGVPDAHIIFFPSWDADGSTFSSDSARRQWERHRRFAGTREPFPEYRDLSAGQWRSLVGISPPVQPQHERRKYLRGSSILKFEGLGDYGKDKFERAQILWEAGFSSRPVALEDGYLESEFVAGTPVETDQNLVAWIRRYLDFLESQFPGDRAVPFDENLEMIRTNVAEGLGSEWADRVEHLERFRAALCAVPTVQIDGRMLPHEFLLTRDGFLKTDSLDHHDDHFFPGCQDIAWDLAAVLVEFGLSDIGNLDRRVKERIPFYLVAYLSYRLGYCSMAAGSSPEADQFAILRDRYAARLRNEIDRLC